MRTVTNDLFSSPVVRPVSTPISCLDRIGLPAQLAQEHVSELVGGQEHDLPALVRMERLKPLGGGAQNTVIYFAGRAALEVAAEPKRLDEATRVIRNGTGAKKSAAA
jgi:hypothetical protein